MSGERAKAALKCAPGMETVRIAMIRNEAGPVGHHK